MKAADKTRRKVDRGVQKLFFSVLFGDFALRKKKSSD